MKTLEDRIKELESVLKQIVNHANEAAMDDGQFRKFARENARYVLENTEVE
jgi:hypothetical protein